MNNDLLWKLSVETSRQAEEALTEQLCRIFREPVCSYTDAKTGATTVSVYLQQPPAKTKKAELETAIRQIRDCELPIGLARISLARIPRLNWAEAWKHHFKPIEVGSRLLVRPSWSRKRTRPGQAVVVIDPGLSFGTGQHPTTAFCMRQLVAHRKAQQAQSFLDIGTGSGILAICAAKLGYAPVEAWDTDPESIRVAGANLRRNHVRARVRLCQKDLARVSGHRREQYSVICANLISNLLLQRHRQILACLEPEGVLVLAGILRAEFPRVRMAYEAAGLRLIASRLEGEWRSGSFGRRFSLKRLAL